jgi:hypothetical protein
MSKYKIIWEELYSKEVEANSKEEAEAIFEALTEEEMAEAYKETTNFEIYKEE